MSIQEIITFIVGLAGGLVFYPCLILSQEITKVALRPFGEKSLRYSENIIGIAAVIFSLSLFFTVAAAWVHQAIQGDHSDWNSMFRVWGRGWFIGFVLYILIPSLERTIRKRYKKK